LGSQNLGLDDEELNLMRLLIAMVSELLSGSSCIEVWVSSLSRSRCADPCFAKGCVEDIGAGNGDMDWIAGVVLLDGPRKVNSS